MEISSDNPCILVWIDGACAENCDERNDECATHNVLSMTENNWQNDKKPTEEMAKASIDEFRRLNPRLIQCDKHNKE